MNGIIDASNIEEYIKNNIDLDGIIENGGRASAILNNDTKNGGAVELYIGTAGNTIETLGFLSDCLDKTKKKYGPETIIEKACVIKGKSEDQGKIGVIVVCKNIGKGSSDKEEDGEKSEAGSKWTFEGEKKNDTTTTTEWGAGKPPTSEEENVSTGPSTTDQNDTSTPLRGARQLTEELMDHLKRQERKCEIDYALNVRKHMSTPMDFSTAKLTKYSSGRKGISVPVTEVDLLRFLSTESTAMGWVKTSWLELQLNSALRNDQRYTLHRELITRLHDMLPWVPDFMKDIVIKKTKPQPSTPVIRKVMAMSATTPVMRWEIFRYEGDEAEALLKQPTTRPNPLSKRVDSPKTYPFDYWLTTERLTEYLGVYGSKTLPKDINFPFGIFNLIKEREMEHFFLEEPISERVSDIEQSTRATTTSANSSNNCNNDNLSTGETQHPEEQK